MPPHRQSNPEIPAVDPALILAMREVVDNGLEPVTARLSAIEARLGKGDTALALMEQRLSQIEPSRSERPAKAKGSLWDRFGIAVLMGAAGTIGGGIGAGALYLLAHSATK